MTKLGEVVKRETSPSKEETEVDGWVTQVQDLRSGDHCSCPVTSHTDVHIIQMFLTKLKYNNMIVTQTMLLS